MNWGKTIKWLFGLLLIITGLGYLIMIFVFNGGLFGVMRSFIPEPDWQGKKIEAARNKSMEVIDLRFGDIERQMDFSEGGRYVHDYCVKGDHDWKRNDPFAYECTLNVARYYSFNDDFRSKLLKLETVFNSEGWHYDGMSISDMLRQYYVNTSKSNYGRTGLVSSLPGLTFDFYRMEIMYAEKDTPISNLELIQSSMKGVSYNRVYNYSSMPKFQDAFGSVIGDNKYLLVILIKQEYFSI